MRILVIDNDFVHRTKLVTLLEDWGYQTISVDNATDAWDVISNNTINFVVTEWILPDISGKKLCEKIRSTNLSYYIYIILLTSLDDTAYIVNGIEIGADDYITKPFKADELRARIRAGERVLNLEKELGKRNSELTNVNQQLQSAYTTIKKELEMAGRFQYKLLPKMVNKIQETSFDWIYLPANGVAGDIFNFFQIDNDNIGFYIIDVSGHGALPAMLALTLSRLLIPDPHLGLPLVNLQDDNKSRKIIKPDVVINQLNKQFQMDDKTALYFTMQYVIVNTSNNSIEICQAGHPKPVYLKSDNTVELVGSNGFPVGMFEDIEYETTNIQYKPGERMFFYSDGVIDCKNIDGVAFGIDRLKRFTYLSKDIPISNVLKRFKEIIYKWKQKDEFDDDISLIIMQMKDKNS